MQKEFFWASVFWGLLLNPFLFGQIIEGDPMAQPHLLSQAHPGSNFEETMELSVSQQSFMQDSMSDQIRTYGLRLKRFAWSDRPQFFSFGVYYQTVSLANGFFKDNRIGIGFAFPLLSLKNRNFYLSTSLGVNRNVWSVDWDKFRESFLFGKYYLINDTVQAAAVSQIHCDGHSSLNFAFALHGEWYASEIFFMRFGSEIKNANRSPTGLFSPTLPGAGGFGSQNPSEHHTYLSLFYGRSVAAPNPDGPLLWDVSFVHNYLLDTTRTLRKPFGRRSQRRHSLLSFSGNLHLRLPNNNYARFGNFLQSSADRNIGVISAPNNTVIPGDSIRQRRKIGFSLGYYRPNYFELSLGYNYTYGSHEVATSHCVNMSLVYVLRGIGFNRICRRFKVD